jgi:hypothetical protein
MKKHLHCLLIVILCWRNTEGQITTPVIRAGFGVDADLRANYFNGFIQSGNDDWFNNGTAGTGRFVIDTTGAAKILAGYMSDVAPYPKRGAALFRSMSVPPFSVVNNRLWYDAMWVRDHHGKDSTVFSAGSNKNGDSPETWTGAFQGLPDKNDILDIFMHMRRSGPTTNDSLWFYGALSLDNVTGNRYFDFEMYQTDIYFDMVTKKFFGYGPDMGHTSWEFDSTGKVTKAGDVIFTASYQSSSLSVVEARIWVSQATYSSVIPTQFNWGGLYDGGYNGAPYGYASIKPNTAGPYYTGLGSGNNVWAGPFQLVLQSDAVVNNYVKDQFMEFSVNLSKLGLDPANLFGMDICGTPFNRMIVKTRASESFTAELKDFIAPLDLFLAPRAEVAAEVPIFCIDTATSLIQVLNPHAGSLYTWSTLNGNIISDSTGIWIQVNTPGTYNVTQYLLAGCSPYAEDLAIVIRDDCEVLPARFRFFSATYNNDSNNEAELEWTISNNYLVRSFTVERSLDGVNFEMTGVILADKNERSDATYGLKQILPENYPWVDYRIKLIGEDGKVIYSKVVKIIMKNRLMAGMMVTPNPVRGKFQLNINSAVAEKGKIILMDLHGRPVLVIDAELKKGINILTVPVGEHWQPGMYNAILKVNKETFSTRFIILE